MFAKTAIDYYECLSGSVPFIVVNGRPGRFPIQRVVVTAAGVVELHCHDGAVETMGSSIDPIDLELLRRIRLHHEGLLFVEVGLPGRPKALQEKILSARFR